MRRVFGSAFISGLAAATAPVFLPRAAGDWGVGPERPNPDARTKLAGVRVFRQKARLADGGGARLLPFSALRKVASECSRAATYPNHWTRNLARQTACRRMVRDTDVERVRTLSITAGCNNETCLRCLASCSCLLISKTNPGGHFHQ